MPDSVAPLKTLASLEEFERLAAKFALLLRPGDVVLLEGELGVGKTTFARKVINTLAGPTVVPSPTFNLIFTYDTTAGQIWHFDLYRLQQVRELQELGVQEAIDNGIVLVEWPQLLVDYGVLDYLLLKLDYAKDNQQRTLRWSCPEASEWRRRLQTGSLWQ